MEDLPRSPIVDELEYERIVEIHRIVRSYLNSVMTNDGKLRISSKNVVGQLPPSRGGSGNVVGLKDHSHNGAAANAQKLIQANTHESPDTDVAPASLHHTLGTTANQAAAGNHPHTPASIGAAPATHAAQHASGGADAVTPAAIGAAASVHAARHAAGGADVITPTAIAAEPALGNPATSGYVLSSTVAGARSWVAGGGGLHAPTHATGGSDPVTPAAIGAAASSHTHPDATPTVSGFESAADKTKLDGIAAGAGGALPAVSVSSTVNITTGSAVWTLLPWNTEAADTNAFHNTVTNSERITIPAGMGGIYLISVGITFANNGTGVRLIAAMLNGVTYDWVDKRAAITGHALQMGFAFTKRLAAGDFIVVSGYQNSGGALDVLAQDLVAGAPCQLSMTRLCP